MENNLDFFSTDTYYQFDDHRLARVHPDWSDDEWYYNVIDTTVEFWMLLDPRDKSINGGLDACLWLDERGRFQLKRHPDYPEAASRDNWTMFYIYRYYARTPEGVPLMGSFRFLVKNSPRMRGMQLWKKALAGSGHAEWWYYTLNIPGARIGNVIWKTLKFLGIFSKEYERTEWNEYGVALQKSMTGYQKWIRRRMMDMVPAFALYKKAWQLYVMPPDPRLDRLREILLRRVGENNPLLRALLGDNVTDIDIRDAIPMTGWPASSELSEYTDRYHIFIPPEMMKANELERPLIRKILKQR